MIKHSKYVTRQLKERNFSDEQIDIVLNILSDILPAEKDDSLSIIRYAEGKFEGKYGGEEVFCTYPMAPQVMNSVNEFKVKHNLTGDKYRKFIEWIMLDGEAKLHRLPMLRDLYNSKLFSIFEESGKEKIVEQKRKVQKKNLLIIE